MMRYAMLTSLAALGLTACVTDDVNHDDVTAPTHREGRQRRSSGR